MNTEEEIMNIQCFPDDILLHIFGYFTVKELCKHSRVCKAWRRIACDKTLWKHIDMTTCSALNLRKVWKFYRTRLSDVLRSLKMNGYYDSKCGYGKQKKQLLSDALLEEISTSCPFIEELHLDKFFLEKMSAKKLPASLTDLALRDCAWSLGWFKGASLSNLRSLDLSKTVHIDDSEIKDITQFTSLEELNLRGLYRFSDNGVKSLAENLPNLKVLNLRSTCVSDLGVHHICRHLKNLVSLDLGSMLSRITDSAVESICNSLFNLKILGLSSPRTGREISDIGVRTLCYSKIAQNITQLDLSFTNIGDPSIVDISDKLVNLEILNVSCCVQLKCGDKLADLYKDLPKLISLKTETGLIANPNL